MRSLVLCLPIVLSACIAVVAAPLPQPLPPEGGGGYAPGPIVPGPGCSQTRLDPAVIIGRRPEELGVERFPFRVRVVPPGRAMTMDYSPARLTLETDANGRIVRFFCG